MLICREAKLPPLGIAPRRRLANLSIRFRRLPIGPNISAAPAASLGEPDIIESMKQGLVFIATFGLAAVFSIDCGAQERDPFQMSREEWQAQVKTSRELIELMRPRHRSLMPRHPTPEEIAEAASRQVLEDYTLAPGDIVSTNRGLFRFRGEPPDRERAPEDFVRVR